MFYSGSWGGGWDEGFTGLENQSFARFNSIMLWEPAEIRETWYSEFARNLIEGGYERLGLELDALNLAVGSGRAVSRCLRPL